MVTEVNGLNAISEGDVLIDFYTETCGPCNRMNPILEEISEEYANIKVVKIDVARNPDISQMFGILTIPTIMFMKNNNVKEIIRGLSNKKTLTSMIKNCIDEK